DEDPNHVGRVKSVTTLEDLLDTVWVGVDCPHDHVQVRRVINDLRLSLEPRRLAFVRPPLLELGYRRSAAPRRVIVLGVDVYRSVGTQRRGAGVGRQGDDGRPLSPSPARRRLLGLSDYLEIESKTKAGQGSE